LGSTAWIPAAANAVLALTISAARLTSRDPLIVARTSASDWRAIRSMSAISAARTRAVGVDQPPRQLGLHRDDRQRVAEDVVQVTCHPLAFGRHREFGHLLPCGRELASADRELA